ncbi:MAG: PD-(D/E)XK nuclease family protein [Clostridia bacterium]|nr:PD-(D/E)XK nuclease family protein [Clostridia bacterium]
MKAVIIPDIKAGFEYLAAAVGDAAADGERVWVIIPDQMALTTERELSRLLPETAQLYFEVVSFRRLADNIFRKYGGISYSYADSCAEALIMRRAVAQCAGTLSVYGKSAESPSIVPVMLSAVRELKQCMITPDALEGAAISAEARAARDGESFPSGKYTDIANIWRVYDTLLSASYDDRLSELSRAAELVSDGRFFEGDTVLVFSFSGFTAQQLAVLRGAERGARDLNVIFTTPSVPDDGVEYDLINDTVSRLYRISRAVGVPFSREVRDVPEKKGGISELSRLLFKNGRGTERPDALTAVRCGSFYDEVESAAIKIAREVRAGARYRDFTVVVGSVESSETIVGEIFGEYNIPCHLSYRVRLESVPESAAVINALRVVTGGWRREDIISYIKTGFSGISRDAADELEIYLDTWNIRGAEFYDPKGGVWGMNPDGYRDGFTESGAERLAAVNEYRALVCEPLEGQADAVAGSSSAAAKALAVREFIKERGLSSDALGEGESVGAQYAKIIERALDAIIICSDEGAVTASDFMGSFSLALDSLTAGTIPAASDEAELTDPVSLRGSGSKYVIMLGCGDNLPSETEPDGIFGEAERTVFEGEGLDFGSPVSRASMELYNFKRAVSSASGEVTFIYAASSDDEGDAPDVMRRIFEVYPEIKRDSFDGKMSADHIYSMGALRRRFTSLESEAERAAAREILSESADGRRILKSAEIPVSQPYETISKERAEALFGGNLSFSQSRIESFVTCKFGFYCDYVLSLEEKKRARLSYADIGTFIHAVLEAVFAGGLYDKEVSDAELDRIIGDYIAGVCPRELSGSARTRGLFRRLRRSVCEFLRAFRLEFESSDFKPVLFELPFGLRSAENSVPPQKIPLGDGTYISFRGIADRVDTYRRDGELWVRVVDYKTGNKTFNIGDFERGFEMQLPIYLFTLVASDDAELTRRMGGQVGDRLMPAGFLYASVRPSDEDVTDAANDEDGDEEEAWKIKKSGLLVGRLDVLSAMEHGLGGKFIPVKQKRDGNFTAASAGSLVYDENFASVYEKMVDTAAGIARELRLGVSDAVPNAPHGMKSPCAHCGKKAVCRSAVTNAGIKTREDLRHD